MLDKGFKPTVIALGYFDSVHLGHQKLIKLAKEYADKHGCTERMSTPRKISPSICTATITVSFSFGKWATYNIFAATEA